MISEKRRMHPVALITNILKELKDSIIPIVMLVVIGGKGEDASFLDKLFVFIIPAVIFSFSIISGLIKWLRFTYRLEEGELRIEHGLFVRKKRYIPFERVQSITTSEGILHRIFGLVKINIETAGGGVGESEAALTAITKEEANTIKQIVKKAKDQHKQKAETEIEETDESREISVVEEQKQFIYSMSYRDIFIFSLTSGGALGIIGALVAFILQFDEILPVDTIITEFQDFVKHGIVMVAIVTLFAIVVAYIIAIIRTMLKYANFRVEKTEENLIISSGLLEIKQVTVPLKRVQGIEIKEGLFRRMFGYAAIHVISAGGSTIDGESGAIMISPLIKKVEIAAIIQKCLPEYQINVSFHPVPERAKTRYIMRPFYRLIIPVIIGAYFFNPWGYLLFLLLPLFMFFGYLSYQFAGWNITGNQLVLRHRFLNANTSYMFKHRIQSLDISQNWLQKRKSLRSVSAVIMSGLGGAGGDTIDMDKDEAMQIFMWYSKTEQQSKLANVNKELEKFNETSDVHKDC
ncbi:PH domain-containing protein [Bacillus kwashiorkori]|uniref:PH domain-containing protein n=1 Tax=Bacillus kwashiorkori TaxID=1522318 RepID=UPI000785BE4C|nr:PH domain-containing protein [Bacillus kwashiorkori]